MPYLFIISQRRHEVHERFVIIIKRMNRICIGWISSRTFEIDAWNFVAWILHEASDFVPAPCSSTYAMHQHKVWLLYFSGFFNFSHVNLFSHGLIANSLHCTLVNLLRLGDFKSWDIIYSWDIVIRSHDSCYFKSCGYVCSVSS